MAFQTNFIAGSTVTISGAVTTSASIEAPSSTQTALDQYTLKDVSWTQNTWVDVHSYTVTAGKTAYITGFTCSLNGDGSYGNVGGFARLYDVTNSKYISCFVFPTDAHNGKTITDYTCKFPAPVPVAAAVNLKIQFFNINAATTLEIVGRIYGVEQ